jgi:uncharacterized Fe-S cluster-containing radical SAM superfamily protein
MYNPIELSKKTEEIVLNGNLKKYYRFRPTGFYGGIATADTVGCNLRCKFCWSSNSVWNVNNVGNFLSPQQVAEKLHYFAYKKEYRQLRISGGEPTIGKKHLLELLENINKSFLFILETNGILLGYNKKYVYDLSKFNNLHVRVCFKGSTEDEFEKLTGAELGFEYQIKSLEFLKDLKMSFNVAVVSIHNNIKHFYKILNEMGLGDIMVEEEVIKLYPLVKKRLETESLLKYFE